MTYMQSLTSENQVEPNEVAPEPEDNRIIS